MLHQATHQPNCLFDARENEQQGLVSKNIASLLRFLKACHVESDTKVHVGVLEIKV